VLRRGGAREQLFEFGECQHDSVECRRGRVELVDQQGHYLPDQPVQEVSIVGRTIDADQESTRDVRDDITGDAELRILF